MFRRRSQTTDAETPAQSLDRLQGTAAQLRDPQAPKGRPTPKRSEAEAYRKKKVVTPKDPKAARKLARDKMREERETQRQALISGDERALPARDRGPVRRFTRDYVDSRFWLGEFFLPIAVIILVMTLLPSLAAKNFSLLLWVGVMVLIAVDTVRQRIGLKKQLGERFPNENLKGVVFYGFMRSLQMRRMRLPKPQVKRGETP